MVQQQSLVWSKYQLAIFEAVKNTNSNIIISAVAGASKTTSIIHAASLLPKTKTILFCAFNKSIAEDLKTKLPLNVECSTLHSLGMKMLLRRYGSGLKLSEHKTSFLAEKLIRTWKIELERKELYKWHLEKAIDLIRMNDIDIEDEDAVQNIFDNYDIYREKDTIKHTQEVFKLVQNYNKGLYSYTTKFICFTDMIFLPAKNNDIIMPKYDITFIDECFPFNQYIVTLNGKEKIGNIVNNFQCGNKEQFVKSYNEKTKIFEYKKILNVWNRPEKELLEIKLASQRKIKCTYNHKFLTQKGWINANKLTENDILLSSSIEQPYHKIANNDQIALFQGSILGDGHVHNISKDIFRLGVIHGIKQKDYCLWKANFLKTELKLIEKNGFSQTQAVTFRSKGYYINNNYLNKEYIINNLTPKILSIMWMDDGNLSKHENGGTLSSTATSEYLANKLSNKLNLLGINNNVKKRQSSSTKKDYWLIYIKKDGINKLCNMIAPYIHNNLSYKIINKYKNKIGIYKWKENNNILGCMIINSIELNKGKEKVYDIEVEDNHNFIITSCSQNKNNSYKYKTTNNDNGASNGFIVHNCQDLNVIQQRFIDKLIKPKTGRFIAVGDKNQSIYQFMGSNEYSFETYENKPNTINLPLSICYRCGTNIVQKAKELVEQIEPWEHSLPGEVRYNGLLNEVQQSDWIICKHNKPLFETYYELLKLKKKSKIRGTDFMNNILLIVKHLRKKSESEGFDYLDEELDKIKEQLYSKGMSNINNHPRIINFREKIEIIQILVKHIGSFIEVYKHLHEMFTDKITNDIILSTVHKSKGLENDRVFILKPELLADTYKTTVDWQIRQNKNLRYVAITRAKKELIYLIDNN